MNKELRFFTTAPGIELRAAADGSPGTLEGYAAVYDQETDLGYFREVIRPGAFSRAIRENQDTRALWNHDTGAILGRRSAGTLSIEEDSKGLKFSLTLPDTTTGRDAAVSIQRGDITGMSFGFSVTSARWLEEKDKDTELREILDLDLFEISPVTFPAYADTEVGLRSRDQFRAEKAGNHKQRAQRLRQLRHAQYIKTRRFLEKKI
jgi:HK97 family phage prohead protease